MSNLSTVRSKFINVGTCLRHLQDINVESFNGECTVALEGSDTITISHPDLDNGWNVRFYVTGNTLEWKTYINQKSFWYAETFAAKMIRKINPRLRIHNEGIDESIEPNFDIEYPTMYSWIKQRLF